MSKIPYPLDHIKAVVFDVDGVLSPVSVPMGDDGIPRRMANLRDGYAMVQAIKHGIKIAVITGADAPGVKERMAMLGIKDIFAGRLDKLPVLQKWMADNGLLPDEVAYVGDDVPDVAPMRWVKLAVAPRDASRDALQVANYVTSAAGGHGVARELLEEVMRAKGIWPTDSFAHGV